MSLLVDVSRYVYLVTALNLLQCYCIFCLFTNIKYFLYDFFIPFGCLSPSCTYLPFILSLVWKPVVFPIRTRLFRYRYRLFAHFSCRSTQLRAPYVRHYLRLSWKGSLTRRRLYSVSVFYFCSIFFWGFPLWKEFFSWLEFFSPIMVSSSIGGFFYEVNLIFHCMNVGTYKCWCSWLCLTSHIEKFLWVSSGKDFTLRKSSRFLRFRGQFTDADPFACKHTVINIPRPKRGNLWN